MKKKYYDHENKFSKCFLELAHKQQETATVANKFTCILFDHLLL